MSKWYEKRGARIDPARGFYTLREAVDLSAAAVVVDDFQVYPDTHTPNSARDLTRQDHTLTLVNLINAGRIVPRSPATFAPNRDFQLSRDGLDGFVIDMAGVRTYCAELALDIVEADEPVDEAVSPAELNPQATADWKLQAQDKARYIIAREKIADRYPSQEDVADEISRDFRKDGIFGTDGKPLAGAYIKRHALKGITSAMPEGWRSQKARGK